MCNNIICGGFWIQPPPGKPDPIDRSCIKWDTEAKNWKNLTVKLKESRDNHVCWGLRSGEVLLFGGADHKSNAEKLSKDGKSSKIAFDLTGNHKHIE